MSYIFWELQVVEKEWADVENNVSDFNNFIFT